ncbi:AraC family transcriptional regulator [Robertkochia aurantiaca]|uniref:AraC family transcriptional regulator n=1 Tax=Robertkochia aurantiaca TaxID=2873700 RepID=UPI001CC981A5|nr:AraC family transcriptional regulator [Robertkochia sp. 3YJGBD-33]
MKIYPFKIPKPSEENLVIQVDKERVFYDRLHQHPEIQVSYLKEGYGKLLLKDNVLSYRSGDLFLIGSEVPHLFRSEPRGDEVSHMISFFLTEDAFGKDFFKQLELRELTTFFERSREGMVLRKEEHELGSVFEGLPEGGSLDQFINVLQLMKSLSKLEGKPLSFLGKGKGLSSVEGKRLQLVFDHVVRYFREPISLSEIAKVVHMTPHAFCRYFKSRTNRTFFEYLIQVRIEHARELLLAGEESTIAEVAYACGFRTLSNFNGKFKALNGITPREFRRRNSHLRGDD